MRRSFKSGMPLKGKVTLVLMLMGLGILGYNVGCFLFQQMIGTKAYNIQDYTTVVTATITSVDSSGIHYIPDSTTLDGYKNIEFLLKTSGVHLFNEQGNKVNPSQLSKDDRLFLLVSSKVILTSNPPQLDVFKPIVVVIG